MVDQDTRAADRFRDEVTSGAFSLNLSRAQVASLAMIAEVGEVACGGHTLGALFRKGLITHIRSQCGRLEYRLTEAGVYALKMARLADLVQGAPDPVAEELRALREQLDTARIQEQRSRMDAWNMTARVQRAYRAIARARSWIYGRPLPRKGPMITLKDQDPERTQAQIIGDLQAAENFLQMEDA
jgi:hypothetical protein